MDPLDERLRAAMKALGDQASDRYFEELPDRTIARLEEVMQSEVPNNSRPPGQKPLPLKVASPPPDKAPREEDSGLHDIRALAQSTKQRMSQRRIPTQNPPVDDTVLHTSSASLRAVALPDPDKMVALEQPIIGNGTGSAPAIPVATDRASAKKIAAAAVATSTATATRTGVATAVASPITPMRPRSKAPMLVVGGVLVAAAAGVVGFMVLNKHPDKGAGSASLEETSTATAPGANQPAKQAAPALSVTPVAPAPNSMGEVAGEGAYADRSAGSAAVTGAFVADDGEGKVDEDKNEAAKGRKDPDDHGHDRKKDDKKKDDVKKDDSKKVTPTTSTDPAKPAGGTAPVKGQDQSLDDLLRGAGVDPDANKKKEAPKLEKKGLDAGDIRKSMSALNKKASGCYGKFGVSGSVAVKLTVAPSGEVKTAKVTGSFAGTPTGDCVASVASGASFPAWDGAPATVNYSYFLDE